ncbi:hypothetical protein ACGFMM_21410 [Streptomyces sp. NPDC048604]|uniref:hypothetical protein n=1 Tax=Streptomyces sp. NPDC048604 TaxID=3365578 RepID=UPI0037232BF4
MGRSRKWLRRLWRDAEVGLAALGQGFGLYTVPECYGYAAVPAAAEPLPERMTPQEAVLWAQLADVWLDAEPELKAMRSRPPRPRPRHE